MRVIYSNGARFAGGGVGTTSYHAVRGLHRHQMLHRLICGSYRPTEIPAERIRAMGFPSRVLRKLAVYDRQRWLDHGYRVLYDHWAIRQVDSCDLLQGWSGYCLRSLQQAKSLGAVTVIDRALAHPAYLNKLLQEEHERWNLPFRWSLSASRIQQEIDAADYVLIPSDFVRETFETEGEVTDNLIQIPFGVDTGHFYPPAQPRTENPFCLLFMGHISIRKGVPYLLEAWKQLNWQDAQLWLAGRNQLDSNLLQRYRDLPGVQFLGHVPDPLQVFHQADVFVFPSLAEGSALVTYEALASGLPVITTPNAGSVVRDGIEGFIVPIRDTAGLAEHLDQLRSDERLRRDMGHAACARAKAFTWERYGDTLAETLRGLVLKAREEL